MSQGDYHKIDLLIGDQTIEISGDGRTVWINGHYGLIGRFSPMSAELITSSQFQCWPHKDDAPTREHWDHFVRIISQVVMVPAELLEDYRPEYIQERHRC